MPSAPYIPPQDGPFDVWALNFSSLITAAPATYGLTAPDAVTITAAYTAWHAAYLLATDPTTRTSPIIAQKDAERAAAEAVFRPFAQNIRANASVTPQAKADLVLNPYNPPRVPIPPPTTFPQLALDRGEPLAHVLRWSDSGTGTGKAKPYGVLGCQVFRVVGTVPAVDPSQASFYAQPTKAPFRSEFAAEQSGKIATYFARWITRSGAGGVAYEGPWSLPLSVVVL